MTSARAAVRLLAAGAVFLLAACSGGGEEGTGAGGGGATPSGGPSETAPVRRIFSDPGMIARGRELYRANCASCHGENAQGAFNWRQRGPDGKWPPPPLDGSGHTWHHPLAALRMTIRNGTQAIGGSMPPWKDRLSDEEIDAVIAWFQSLWPDEVYRQWLAIDARARRRAAR